jgi:hypothetical protein
MHRCSAQAACSRKRSFAESLSIVTAHFLCNFVALFNGKISAEESKSSKLACARAACPIVRSLHVRPSPSLRVSIQTARASPPREQ